ncbi:RNA polymerase-associated protein LEO1-like isoform X3 [Mytilus californianus]|uniref:RNA polymerase-associated protein LEO1-like isoform X3 n=1 Tax=Mytilus californianus TaxID=6549 RepID=UPI00224553EA|nr:RNA polymerase-associated protein LEO1-like isoform X3 [Mytilus californianus]
MAESRELFGSDESGNESDGSGHGSVPGTPGGSSPAHSGSPPGSPAQHSGSEHSLQGTPVGSPLGSHRSHRSGSRSPGSHRSGSGSPHSHRSGSGSPRSHRSGSGSPRSHRSGSGSPKSGSPMSVKSRSRSPGSVKSHSQSPRSRSGSPRSKSGSPKSRSGSPKSRSGSPRSRSGSPRSRSGSPRSKSGSPRSRSGSARSRSGSPRSRSGSARSRSGSPRSRSGSPRSRSRSPRSKSGSPRSKAGSPRSRSRSRSGSRKSGSGSDSDIGRRKKRRIMGSDEEDQNGRVDATVDNLFGDADDISSDEEDKEKRSEAGDRDDQRGRGSDEEEEIEEPQETLIEVEIPRIITNLGKTIHYVKLPNFLSVETRPYDPTSYEDEIDEDEVLDEEGRARLKLKVENAIRWRKVKDADGNDVLDELGAPKKESNARIVRWTDGSMSLHLGQEIFDVHTMPIQGDFNHLFVRQGTGLQGQSVFRTKVAFRPHSTESFTHRKMTLSLADRSTKAQKVKVLPIHGKDPDANRTEMIKKEEEKLRAAIRMEGTRKRQKERHVAKGLSGGYLESGDEEEEGDISIAAIKKHYKNARDRPNIPDIYSSDSDSYDSDKERSGAQRLMKAKKGPVEDDSDSDTGHKKKKARIVESDEESEAGSGGGGKQSGSESEKNKSGSESE